MSNSVSSTDRARPSQLSYSVRSSGTYCSPCVDQGQTEHNQHNPNIYTTASSLHSGPTCRAERYHCLHDSESNTQSGMAQLALHTNDPRVEDDMVNESVMHGEVNIGILMTAMHDCALKASQLYQTHLKGHPNLGSTRPFNVTIRILFCLIPRVSPPRAQQP